MLDPNPMRFSAQVVSLFTVILSGCFAPADRLHTLESRVHEMSVEQSALRADLMLANDGLLRTNARLKRAIEQLERLASRPAWSSKIDLSEQELQSRLDSNSRRASDPKPSASPRELVRLSGDASPELRPELKGPHGFASDTLRLAEEKAKAGDVREARLLYAELLATWPENELAGEAHHGLAETYFAEGDCHRALPEYDVVIQKFPQTRSTPAAYLRSADCFTELKRTPEAKNALETLSARFPDSVPARAVKQRLADLENKPTWWR